MATVMLPTAAHSGGVIVWKKPRSARRHQGNLGTLLRVSRSSSYLSCGSPSLSPF